jgi:hypothetical protein
MPTWPIFAGMSIVVPMRESTREANTMKCHEFTLVLTADPDEQQADELYGKFDDGTIATIAGVPQIHFHREAGSLEEAIRTAIADVRSLGFDVALVEMEPSAVTQPS